MISALHLRRRAAVKLAVCMLVIFVLMSLYSSGGEDARIQVLEDTRPVADSVASASFLDDVADGDVYQQLQLTLSPANVRAQCRSMMSPGGQCQCVDVQKGNADECLMVPVMDGQKTVCLDVLPPGKPCLVYSFGVKDDYSFELAMVKFGCTVHAFDPTVRLNTTALEKLGVHMHYIGVDGSGWTAHSDQFGDMPLMTLDQLVSHLGHQRTRIDYLKLDVEGSEWDILRDQLIDGGRTLRSIPQMTIEFHLMFPRGTLQPDAKVMRTLPERADAVRFLRVVRELEAAGFRLLESRPDFNKYSGTELAFIYETMWMKG